MRNHTLGRPSNRLPAFPHLACLSRNRRPVFVACLYRRCRIPQLDWLGHFLFCGDWFWSAGCAAIVLPPVVTRIGYFLSSLLERTKFTGGN